MVQDILTTSSWAMNNHLQTDTMKKVFYTFAAVTLLALGMTSCQKDQTVVKYTATIERASAKTSVGSLEDFNASHPVTWEHGDKITVFRTSDGVEFPFITNDDNSEQALFVYDGDGSCEGLHGVGVKAGYPADYFHHMGQIQIPTKQTYRDNNVDKFPMYAVAADGQSELAFKNLCGIVRIKMPNYSQIADDPRIDVKKVVVWTDLQISGIFDIDGNGTSARPLNPVSGSDEIEMTFENAISLNDETDDYIYIALPAATYNTLAFQFYTTASENKYLEVKSTQSITIPRSVVTTVDFSDITPATGNWEPTPEPRSPNFYSVAEDLQVNFAKGNLVYNGSSWGIAATQATVYNNENGYTDFFARSVDGNNFGVPTMGNDEILGYVVTSAPSITGTFVDWSNAVSEYNTNGNTWRTLTKDEWDHLLTKRPSAYDLHYFVRVNRGNDGDISGLLIFPDGWTNTHGYELDDRSYVDQSSEHHGIHFATNSLTTEQFNTLVSEGTFIPAGGFYSIFFGSPSPNYYTFETDNPYGCYWCSDYDDNNHNAVQFIIDYDYRGWVNEYYTIYWGMNQAIGDDVDFYFNQVRLAYDAKRKNTTTESWSAITAPAIIPTITSPSSAKGKRR